MANLQRCFLYALSNDSKLRESLDVFYVPVRDVWDVYVILPSLVDQEQLTFQPFLLLFPGLLRRITRLKMATPTNIDESIEQLTVSRILIWKCRVEF